jgi:hypothetical protein
MMTPPLTSTAAFALPLRALPTFALIIAAAALFALTSRYPGYVHHDTAEIAMWSTLGWPLGLPKHPPLLPWLFRTYSTLVPLNWGTIGLLTAANITLGAWAVWRIAVLTIGERRAQVALMLYGLAPAGTFFALKLNHNAILVSLWPLTILAFLACLKAETAARSVSTGAAFGALAAAAMLAKYYSGVLLICCFAASLVSPFRNRFYRMPGGYACVLVFITLLAPHGWWLIVHQADTLAYALHESERDAHPILHFLVVAPAYLIPPLLVFLALCSQHALSRDGRRSVDLKVDSFGGRFTPSRLASLWRAHPELVVLAIGPYLMTAAFIAAFGLRGATSWSLPDFCVVPVLLAALLPIPDAGGAERLNRWGTSGLAAVALAGPIVLFASFALKDLNATEPRAELVKVAGDIYLSALGVGPTIVAGDPQFANAAALGIPSQPRAFTNFFGAYAPWIKPTDIAQEGALVVCRTTDQTCSQNAEQVGPGQRRLNCRLSRRREYLGLKGSSFSITATVIAPLDHAAGFQTGCDANQGVGTP